MVSTVSTASVEGPSVVCVVGWILSVYTGDVLEVDGCSGLEVGGTEDVVCVGSGVSVGFSGRGVVDLEEVGMDCSVVNDTKGSLVSVPVTGEVFRVLRAPTAVVNSVECAGVILGGQTASVCNGADTVGRAVAAEVLDSNAGALVTGEVSALKGSTVSVESTMGFVVLEERVESWETVARSVLVMSRGETRNVGEVGSVVPLPGDTESVLAPMG